MGCFLILRQNFVRLKINLWTNFLSCTYKSLIKYTVKHMWVKVLEFFMAHYYESIISYKSLTKSQSIFICWVISFQDMHHYIIIHNIINLSHQIVLRIKFILYSMNSPNIIEKININPYNCIRWNLQYFKLAIGE